MREVLGKGDSRGGNEEQGLLEEVRSRVEKLVVEDYDKQLTINAALVGFPSSFHSFYVAFQAIWLGWGWSRCYSSCLQRDYPDSYVSKEGLEHSYWVFFDNQPSNLEKFRKLKNGF